MRPEKDGVDVALIEHISPIEWDNCYSTENTSSIDG